MNKEQKLSKEAQEARDIMNDWHIEEYNDDYHTIKEKEE